MGNGDPTSHERSKQSWRSCYHGLARVLVQVTTNAASSGRARQAEIDLDSDAVWTGLGGADGSIVVEARVEGMLPARATIAVSADEATHGVMAVAARSVHADLVVE